MTRLWQFVMNDRLRCSYPECGCKGLPIGVKAALGTTLEPSEEEVEAATEAIVQGDRMQMLGSGLEPSSEKLRPVYRDFARAALVAAAKTRIKE
jgi:hypothetical protein